MLAEQYLELLTAYIDGELSTRRQRWVQKLLKKSPEARAILHKLQQDSRDLMELPLPPPAPDVSFCVMQAIAQRGVHPCRRHRPVAGTIPLWRGVAAAAAVLLLAAGASFLFFQSMSETGRQGEIASNRKKPNVAQPDNGNPVKPAPRDIDMVKWQPEERRPLDPPHASTGSPAAVKPPEKKPAPEKAPVSPETPEPGPIYTAPSMGVFNPHEAEVALPTLLRLRDLAQEKPRQTLIQELSRHDGFYIELLCREATHAFPALQAALQANGFDTIVDGLASQRLKQPNLKTNYVVYLDNVTPEELAKLLQPLAQDDPKADKKKPAYGQYLSAEANLIVCPLSGEHRRKILGYLGADPRQAKATGPLGVDLTRPLSEQTADQLTPGRPTTRPPSKSDRSALAMVHGTMPRSQSAEVKRFLDGHKPGRKGTLQILLVLRGRP